MTGFSIILGAIILAVLLVRAIWVLREEAARDDGGRPRGIPPGKGYTEVDSNYSSGLGGGHQMTTRIPKDPQEYARAFVPKRRTKDRS